MPYGRGARAIALMSVRCLLNTCANVERSLTSHLRLDACGCVHAERTPNCDVGVRGSRAGGSDQCAHQVLQKTNIIQITLRFYAKILTGILSVTCGAEQPRITHTLTRTLAELLERRADLVFFALVVFIE